MDIDMGCARHIGGRQEQQDEVACFADPDTGTYFLVLADGMGGSQGGALAAQTVIETAKRYWETCRGMPGDPDEFLEEFCQQAHRSIRFMSEESGTTGHSTLVALLICEDQANWIHVGDSRLYHFKSPTIWQRTKDHSVVQALVDAGQITEEQMSRHPDQNKLLNGLGGKDAPETTHGSATIAPGHHFLLCSDGFWSTITPVEMGCLLRAPNLSVATTFWVDRAARRAGKDGDNVSLAVLRVKEDLCQTTLSSEDNSSTLNLCS